MVLGLKLMGKPTTLNIYIYIYKFWTEPKSCMILGFKPMGKLATPRKSKY